MCDLLIEGVAVISFNNAYLLNNGRKRLDNNGDKISVNNDKIIISDLRAVSEKMFI